MTALKTGQVLDESPSPRKRTAPGSKDVHPAHWIHPSTPPDAQDKKKKQQQSAAARDPEEELESLVGRLKHLDGKGIVFY